MGGADDGKRVLRVADHWEKMLLCKFLFSCFKFLKLNTYIYADFHVKYNIEP